VTYYPTVDASATLQVPADMVILPQSTVMVAGRIASIQFYASAAGSLTIYVSEKHLYSRLDNAMHEIIALAPSPCVYCSANLLLRYEHVWNLR
jgi:hypothetical protein